MIQYGGKGLLICDADFSYKGVVKNGSVIIDSGAEVALLDRPFAESLGLPLMLQGYSTGVGGITPAWGSRVDSIQLTDLPQCEAKSMDVSVSSLPVIRPAVALLGIGALGLFNMGIQFYPDKAVVGCTKAGAPTSTVTVSYSKISSIPGWKELSQGENKTVVVMAITGLLLGGIVIYTLTH